MNKVKVGVGSFFTSMKNKASKTYSDINGSLDSYNARLERPYEKSMDGDQILEEVNVVTDKTAAKLVAIHENLTEENAEDVTKRAE